MLLLLLLLFAVRCSVFFLSIWAFFSLTPNVFGFACVCLGADRNMQDCIAPQGLHCENLQRVERRGVCTRAVVDEEEGVLLLTVTSQRCQPMAFRSVGARRTCGSHNAHSAALISSFQGSTSLASTNKTVQQCLLAASRGRVLDLLEHSLFLQAHLSCECSLEGSFYSCSLTP